MARIAGVDLPAKKRAEIGLTYIYGIGRTRALSLLHRAGVDATKKVADLTEDEVNRIRTLIENEGSVEGDLRKELSMNIKRLIEMGSYRGLRHRRGLPVRGQRTHTNARTRKGPRRGTVANKKKATGEDLRTGIDHGKSSRKKYQEENLQEEGKEESSPTAWCTCRLRSTTPSSLLPIRSGTCWPGRVPVRSGFRGSRKGTPFAAQQASLTAANKAKESGCASVEVRVSGPGAGRESAVRALSTAGIEVRIDQGSHADPA